MKSRLAWISLIGLLVSSAAFADGGWAVIVWNPSTNSLGSSHGSATRAEAENMALGYCGAGCAGVSPAELESGQTPLRETWILNGWVAVATDNLGRWASSGIHDSRYEAEQAALTRCGSSSCFVVRSLSSYSYMPDQDGTNNVGALIPALPAQPQPQPPAGPPVTYRWLDGNDSQIHCYEFDLNGNELNNDMPVDDSYCGGNAPYSYRWLDGNDSQIHCYEFDPQGNELNNNMPVDNSYCGGQPVPISYRWLDGNDSQMHCYEFDNSGNELNNDMPVDPSYCGGNAPYSYRWLDGNDSQMHCYEFDPQGNELNNNMPVDNSYCYGARY